MRTTANLLPFYTNLLVRLKQRSADVDSMLSTVIQLIIQNFKKKDHFTENTRALQYFSKNKISAAKKSSKILMNNFLRELRQAS